MASVERSVEVNVPVSTAYNQWTQFEQFPQFMEGIEEVRQLDNKRMHWRAQIAGKEKEWDAEIVDQVPDQRVAWRSLSGAPNDGVVTFRPIDANRTEVTLSLDYEPEGILENVGSALGLVTGRVDGDLRRFKKFIEARGAEAGGWRGEIHGGQESGSGATSASSQGGSTTTGQASTSGQAMTGQASTSDQAMTGQASMSGQAMSGQASMSGQATTGQASTSGYAATTGTQASSGVGQQTGEIVLPVIEEQVQVGKREVESGGVRVNTRVEEVPVNEQVTLREEEVEVQRRPVNRPASEADFNAAQQGTIEVREMDEQAVVAKQARVVEEIVVNKEVQQHTETIQETARRIDVDVEQIPGQTRTTGSSQTELGGTTNIDSDLDRGRV
jgi:uncharacterized protein (TIGR02271 family)